MLTLTLSQQRIAKTLKLHVIATNCLKRHSDQAFQTTFILFSSEIKSSFLKQPLKKQVPKTFKQHGNADINILKHSKQHDNCSTQNSDETRGCRHGKERCSEDHPTTEKCRSLSDDQSCIWRVVQLHP